MPIFILENKTNSELQYNVRTEDGRRLVSGSVPAKKDTSDNLPEEKGYTASVWTSKGLTSDPFKGNRKLTLAFTDAPL